MSVYLQKIPPAADERLVRTATPRYLFGDSEVASRRLGVLAEVFAPSTRRLLLKSGLARPRLAVDLGCGPGYSTHLLAEVLGCDRVVGLDISRRFVSLAEATATDRVSFRRHDVASLPFPLGPGDLLFSRFLLTHVREPETAVLRWASQLRPNGHLVLEEVEWIETTNAVFTTYTRIVEALLEHESNTLCIGPVLDGLGDFPLLRRRRSWLERLRVGNQDAATMFMLNLKAWKDHPFVQSNWAGSTTDRLEADLRALAAAPTPDAEIEWGLRQLVFERV